eukprot:6469910-Amphidinium_carterae.1
MADAPVIKVPRDGEKVKPIDVYAPDIVLDAAKHPEHIGRFVIFKVPEREDFQWAEVFDGARFTCPKERQHNRKRSMSEVIQEMESGGGKDNAKPGAKAEYGITTKTGKELAIEVDTATSDSVVPIISSMWLAHRLQKKDMPEKHMVEVAGRPLSVVRVLPLACAPSNRSVGSDKRPQHSERSRGVTMRPKKRQRVCLMEIQSDLFIGGQEVARRDLKIESYVPERTREEDEEEPLPAETTFANDPPTPHKRKEAGMSLVAHFADAPLMKMKGYKISRVKDKRCPEAKLLLGVHLPNTGEMSLYETTIFAMRTYKQRNVVAEPVRAQASEWEKRMKDKLATYKEFAAAKKKAQKDKMEEMKRNLASVYTPEEQNQTDATA